MAKEFLIFTPSGQDEAYVPPVHELRSPELEGGQYFTTCGQSDGPEFIVLEGDADWQLTCAYCQDGSNVIKRIAQH